MERDRYFTQNLTLRAQFCQKKLPRLIDIDPPVKLYEKKRFSTTSWMVSKDMKMTPCPGTTRPMRGMHPL